MKGIVLHQPWAHAMLPGPGRARPLKTYETRGKPFAGLAPAGVRPLPGCKIEPGERVAILAAVDRATWRELRAAGPVAGLEHVTDEDHLAWGCVIGTVRFTVALRIGGPTSFSTGSREGDEGDHPAEDVLVVHAWPGRPGAEARTLVLDRAHGRNEDVSPELPWGTYEPGRWAMKAEDPVRLRVAVPVLGQQGLHHLQGTTSGTECPRCYDTMLTTEHHDEYDWCPSCGWVDE